MGIVLKAEKEKDEDGVPVTPGQVSQAVLQRFIFSLLQTQHQQRWECLFFIGTGASRGHENKHLLLLKQTNKKKSQGKANYNHLKYINM